MRIQIGDALKATKLTFAWVTPSRWSDLEELFGDRGACGGCWCMAWRLRHKDWVAGKGPRNKRALKKLVTSGAKPGVLAYAGRVPIAWCSLAPRSEYLFLERSRVLAPLDEEKVWSVSCLFVLRSYRGQGVSGKLLRAAAELAAKRGARWVEGYPVVARTGSLPDAFAWTGLPGAFEKAGFREVARRSPARPIMRRRIRGARKRRTPPPAR